MTCLTEPYVQIGLAKYLFRPDSSFRKSITPGQSTATINIEASHLQTFPDVPNFICANLNSSTKLWAGIVTGYQVSDITVDGFVVQPIVQDFTYYLNFDKIGLYDPQFQATMEDHILNCKTLAGLPSFGTVIYGGDSEFIPTAVQEKSLREAIDEFCKQTGRRWKTTIGLGWNNLDTLLTQLESRPTTDVFEVVIWKQGEFLGDAPFDIVLPPNSCVQDFLANSVRYSIAAPDINRVTVLGANATMATSAWPNIDRETTLPIPSDSTQRYYGTLPDAVAVTQVQMLKIARILTLTPLSGPIGTVVQIDGLNFTGATTVEFNGTAATSFTVVNDRLITATVPTGATTGKVTVSTPAQPTGGGDAESFSDFTVM